MECINYNNKLYIINKNLDENNNDFIKRYWYIIKTYESNNYSFDHVINLSNIYINEIINNCKY